MLRTINNNKEDNSVDNKQNTTTQIMKTIKGKSFSLIEINISKLFHLADFIKIGMDHLQAYPLKTIIRILRKNNLMFADKDAVYIRNHHDFSEYIRYREYLIKLYENANSIYNKLMSFLKKTKNPTQLTRSDIQDIYDVIKDLKYLSVMPRAFSSPSVLTNAVFHGNEVSSLEPELPSIDPAVNDGNYGDNNDILITSENIDYILDNILGGTEETIDAVDEGPDEADHEGLDDEQTLVLRNARSSRILILESSLGLLSTGAQQPPLVSSVFENSSAAEGTMSLSLLRSSQE